MGNSCSFACAMLALLAQVTLAEYFMRIIDSSKQPGFVFNERVLPRLDLANSPFGSATLGLEGAVKISEWSYGFQRNVYMSPGNSGVDIGATYYGGFIIKRTPDAYSPTLFQYATGPTSTLSLTLATTSGVGRGAVQLSALHNLTGVYVISLYQAATTTNSEPPKETIGISYKTLSMQYGSFGPDGKIDAVNTWGWDWLQARALL